MTKESQVSIVSMEMQIQPRRGCYVATVTALVNGKTRRIVAWWSPGDHKIRHANYVPHDPGRGGRTLILRRANGVRVALEKAMHVQIAAGQYVKKDPPPMPEPGPPDVHAVLSEIATRIEVIARELGEPKANRALRQLVKEMRAEIRRI